MELPLQVAALREGVEQVWLEVSFARGLQPRPNRRGHASEDSDSATADLQFRGRMEYAVGHGVSVAVVRPAEGGPATTARTTWIPAMRCPASSRRSCPP
jgi:hypothetical protein